MEAGVWHITGMPKPLPPPKKPPHRRTFIREWREYRGLTQEQLADRLEDVMGQGSLSRLERGLTGYTQASLEAIADALGCDVADLLGRLPGAPSELTLIVNRLPPEKREQALTILKAIANG